MFRLERLRAQVPTLYVTTMLVVLTAMSAADPSAPVYLKYCLPVAIIVTCGVRLLWWLRTRRSSTSPNEAQRINNRAAIIAALICVTAAIWTVTSWLESAPGQRTYYPLFMVIGALAAAFCLSSARVATVLVLATGIGPVIGAQLLAGNEMDRLAASVIFLATLFLLRMNQQQHDQQIDLLRLQRHMREQAATDALTGIGNRRALYERLEGELAAGRSVGLVLLDLDGFKPVNDAHGHAAGDRLLIAVAERLRTIAPDVATAYRLGGDEFAVVANRSGDYHTQLLATSILGGIATPFDIDGLMLAVGACTGAANSRADDSVHSLLARADERLYVAKALRYSGKFDRRAKRAPAQRRQA